MRMWINNIVITSSARRERLSSASWDFPNGIMRELSKSLRSDILQILYGFIIEWKLSPLAVYLHFIKHIGRNPEIERVNILFYKSPS